MSFAKIGSNSVFLASGGLGGTGGGLDGCQERDSRLRNGGQPEQTWDPLAPCNARGFQLQTSLLAVAARRWCRAPVFATVSRSSLSARAIWRIANAVLAERVTMSLRPQRRCPHPRVKFELSCLNGPGKRNCASTAVQSPWMSQGQHRTQKSILQARQPSKNRRRPHASIFSRLTLAIATVVWLESHGVCQRFVHFVALSQESVQG